MIKKFFKEHSIHKSIVTYMDWLFVFNIPYFFILWMVFCWGMGAAYFNQGLESTFYFQIKFSISELIFFIGLTLVLGGINIYNQSDELLHVLDWKKTDTGQYKKQLNYLYVSPNFIHPNSLSTIPLVFILIGLGLSLTFSFYSSVILIFYSLLNIFFYKYAIDILTVQNFAFRCFFVLINNLLLFLSGWIYFNHSDIFDILIYIPLFFMATLSILLINEIILCDKYSKKDSPHIAFIERYKVNIAAISLILMIVLFISSNYIINNPDPITSHFSIIAIPFLIYAFLRSEEKDYIRSFNYPIMIMNILLSWTLFPFLFLAQFFIYYLSKYYYWHRFNIHFPKFAMDEND